MLNLPKTAALLALTGAILLASAACKGHAPTPGPGGGGSESDGRKAVTASEGAKAAASRANAFGFRLFGELAKQQSSGNFAVSGASAAMAFALFQQGNEGKGREAIATALGYAGADESRLAADYGDLFAVLNGKSKSTVLMANALFTKQGLTIEDAFLKSATGPFHAEVKSRDMGDPATLKELNDWCSKQTDGMIPKMLDQIDRDTFAVILNALYFRGTWLKQFDPRKTTEANFYPEGGKGPSGGDGGSFKVPMMSGEVDAVMWSGETFGAVRLPYEAGDYSMVLMMPVYGKTSGDMRAALTPAMWGELWGHLQRKPDELDVSLPKFRLSSNHDLNRALTGMGLGDALIAGRADYSRMVKGMDANAQVAADVRQRVVVEVDEKGTKAAAVTSIEAKVTSAPMFSPHFNRPFMFAIVEHQTGAILFLGQVHDPRKE